MTADVTSQSMCSPGRGQGGWSSDSTRTDDVMNRAVTEINRCTGSFPGQSIISEQSVGKVLGGESGGELERKVGELEKELFVKNRYIESMTQYSIFT